MSEMDPELMDIAMRCPLIGVTKDNNKMHAVVLDEVMRAATGKHSVVPAACGTATTSTFTGPDDAGIGRPLSWPPDLASMRGWVRCDTCDALTGRMEIRTVFEDAS